MSHRTQVTEEIRAIPKERLAKKIGRTGFGLLFLSGAIAAAWKLGWPWYVVVPIAGFAGHIISADLTTKGTRFVVALVKDLVLALRQRPTP